MVTAVAQAQQISVVSSNGATTLYSTLKDAIEGASEGSVIYLPGGGFPISDDVKITKKLTILGIGNKANTENVDGNTILNGNIFFNQGSSGSALMGCYVTGRVNIGQDSQVDNVMVKCCSFNGLSVHNASCSGTLISQNYIRSDIHLSKSEITITNNVIRYVSNYNYVIHDMGAGIFSNNIVRAGWSNIFWNPVAAIITGNIFLNTPSFTDATPQTSGNMCLNGEFGEETIKIEADSWDDVFVNYNDGKAEPSSNFHFKEAYKKYENQVGIYATGVDFDNQMAPVPYIVAKHVDPQTDASGKLNIKIRVKAGK